MTPDQLEREIRHEFESRYAKMYCHVSKDDQEHMFAPAAKACAELFRKELREVAEKAIDDLIDRNTSKSPVAKILRQQYERDKQEWLKENLLNDNDQG